MSGKSVVSTPAPAAAAGDVLQRAGYVATQGARVAWYLAHYALTKRIAAGQSAEIDSAKSSDKVSPSLGNASNPVAARQAFLDVFTQDLANIEDGLYPAPRGLDLRQTRQALDASARYLRDLPKVDHRRRQRLARDIPDTDQPAQQYPAYYTQNFHYQSGGWLTEESARLYDTQVEVLFTGTADAMRRSVLAEIGRELRGKDQRAVKLLDAACGSGRFLRQTLDAFPRLDATGLDLSPAYCDNAREVLAQWPRVSVVQSDLGNAPFTDGHFDLLTCVYLFHEIPPKIRKTMANEIARLIKPGGLFVFADSVQIDDAPAFAQSIDRFPDLFHEPYYRSYQRTDLEALFKEAGFVLERRKVAFLTKVLTFRRL